jgi:hypothetical protein
LNELCIKAIGALSIPFGKDIAVNQEMYFCADKDCLRKAPKWTNVKYGINSLVTDEEVSVAEREQCNL